MKALRDYLSQIVAEGDKAKSKKLTDKDMDKLADKALKTTDFSLVAQAFQVGDTVRYEGFEYEIKEMDEDKDNILLVRTNSEPVFANHTQQDFKLIIPQKMRMSGSEFYTAYVNKQDDSIKDELLPVNKQKNNNAD